MARLKARGEVETFDLGEISGVEVLTGITISLRHEGSQLVNAWSKRLQAAKLAEVRRVSTLFAEYGEETLREMFEPAHKSLEAARLARVADIEAGGGEVPETLSEPIPFRTAVSTVDASNELEKIQVDAVAECAESLRGPGLELVEGEAIAQECLRWGVLGVAYRKANEVQRISAPEFPVASSAGGDGRSGDPEPQRGTAVG